MPTSPEFLIEGILPANEVHLLAGSSGAGKTTFLFQTLAAWQEGHPIFGHASFPVPYVYISLDRSRLSVNRTLGRLDLEGVIDPILSREDFPKSSIGFVDKVITHAQSKYPKTELFVIEGFQTLVGDRGNHYTPVASLLGDATTICAKQGITILGIAHSPKMKTDESFQHPREMISGSSAWGAYSDTVIILNLNESSGVISVKVLPRNAPMEEHGFVFGPQGKLIPLDAARPKEALALRIESLTNGQSISRQEILDWAEDLDLSRATADRVITQCLKNKVLEAISPGVYARTLRVPLRSVSNTDLTVDL